MKLFAPEPGTNGIAGRLELRIFRLLAASALALAGCGDPSFGDMPALCSTDGACPEGYDCIHGVCALPGTPVPITVARVGNLRGVDLRMVPQPSSVLVAWQSYAYSEEGQTFVGARVTASGVVSPRMDLVGRFVAEDDSLEPYFDVLSVDKDRLLVAISAPSLPDDTSVDPRLITYRVDLPPEGSESLAPTFEPAWPAEERVKTVGYGAVSLPKLLDRGDSIDLAYVQSRTTSMSTLAELAVFSMDREGTPKAPVYHSVRSGLSVAVGVFEAFRFDTGSWWIMDDERPSALYVLDAGATKETVLERLAVPVAKEGASLIYVTPSERMGDKLATSPVTGPSALRKVSIVDASGQLQASDAPINKAFPTIRDFPRPAWVARQDAPAILATPGADAFSTNIFVYTVAPNGTATLVHTIPRFSTRLLEAVRALVVGDKLFVAWLETDAETGSIRMAILPEP